MRGVLVLHGQRRSDTGRLAHRHRVAGDAIADVSDEVAADAPPGHHQAINVFGDDGHAAGCRRAVLCAVMNWTFPLLVTRKH